jgi:glycosyltransferase involved in cell wall biosynthesis
MRVCVLALDDPWRQHDGGTVRTRLLIEALAALGHDTCVAYVSHVDAEKPEIPGVVLRSVTTTPLGERGWTKPFKKYKQRFLPLPTIRGGMIPTLGQQIAELEPDVLVVSQLRAAPYSRFAPRSALWLDQADVWSLFLDREASSRRGLPRLTSKMQLRQIRRAEMAWTKSAAAISTAGYGDRAYLSSLTDKPVEWLPTAVAPVDIPRGPAGGRTAGFLANFAFWPNQDAFILLRDQWAPALREIGWDTVVAGIGSEHLDGDGRVEILGQIDDLGDYYSRIDVALAPIRLGGGIKVKVIEALMYQRPVLATAYALEGFPPDLAAAIPVVADRAPAFAEILNDILDSDTAIRLAHKYFSIQSWEATVKRLVATASEEAAS